MGHRSTSFASPERSSPERVREQSGYFAADDFFVELLDLVPVIIMVLNRHRQLVFGNKALLDILSLSTFDDILGKRPGEIFHCRNFDKNEAGCGTTEFCRYCGAVNTILKSQQEDSALSECRILTTLNGHEEALDLRVWASQLQKNNEAFTFFTVMNIEDEKRRLFLERIFLHDIGNSCHALMGLSGLIEGREVKEAEKKKFIQKISGLSKTIANEIKAHQQLVAAEYNQLELNLEQVDSLQFLTELYELHNEEETLNGRLLEIDQGTAQITFQTDRILLNRVIGNMIKNGLEGSVPGEIVRMGCYAEGDQIFLWVHNPTYMPENIRLQLFNRSFSTKGAGRGLGTYSMKYFTEKYLQGSIAFTSEENTGSRFTVCYPLSQQ